MLNASFEKDKNFLYLYKTCSNFSFQVLDKKKLNKMISKAKRNEDHLSAIPVVTEATKTSGESKTEENEKTMGSVEHLNQKEASNEPENVKKTQNGKIKVT